MLCCTHREIYLLSFNSRSVYRLSHQAASGKRRRLSPTLDGGRDKFTIATINLNSKRIRFAVNSTV